MRRMIETEARAEFAALQREEASFKGTEAEKEAREMRRRALWQQHGEAWTHEDLGFGQATSPGGTKTLLHARG